MANINVTLVRKETIADGTMAFYFSRPAGYEFQAGQFVDLTLLNPPETDDEGNLRSFSLASAPQESELMIASRLRDTAFKRVLRDMPLGGEVNLDGPYGNFLLHENSARPAIMLAGGIGVTPFRSIIFDTARRQLPHKIYLFHSNRRPEDTVFTADFSEAEKMNANFAYIPTMTALENSQANWTGERGYISTVMIDRYFSGSTNAIYYIAGPAKMVKAMREMLNSAGVSNDDIKTEEFLGY